MQQFPLLNFPQFRIILERCQCVITLMATYGDSGLFHGGMPNPSLYSIEREVGGELRGIVIHIWDDDGIVPLDVIRGVLDNLDIDEDVFFPLN